MPWHPFHPGGRYSVDELIEVLRKRLPRIIDKSAKLREIELFERYRGIEIIWSPFATRWGRSPYNRNAWKRLDGADFITLPAGPS